MPFQKGNKGFRSKESYLKGVQTLRKNNQERLATLGYIMSPEARKKISLSTKGRKPWNKDRPWTSEERKKIGAGIKNKLWGKDNPAWKDKEVGYHNRHVRVVRRKGKASESECAYKDETCFGRMQWASISHRALPEIEDYMPLCQSHHARYDKHIDKIRRDPKTGQLIKKSSQ